MEDLVNMSADDFAQSMYKNIIDVEQKKEDENIVYLDNVIDDEYESYKIDKRTHIGKVLLLLKDKLPNFDEYLFTTYLKDSWSPPNTAEVYHPKKVLICSSEHNLIPLDQVKNNYHHIFAQYYWDNDNITSIPLGCFNFSKKDSPPIDERMYDTSFVGCLNKNRVELASVITGIPKTIMALGFYFNDPLTMKLINHMANWTNKKTFYKFNVDFNMGISGDNYLAILQNSKISLCPRGWSNIETYRLYESLESGCVVITEKLPDRPYFKNIPAIQVNNWKEGMQIAADLLKDQSSLLTRIGEESRKFYEEKLSPEATAKIIISKLAEKAI